MNKIGDISVIVPVFNGRVYLKQCLDSIVNQSLVPAEIHVIDDGSTDNSAEVILEYPSIQYHRIENRGVAEARNYGIQISKASWIAFLDQDDFWPANSLEVRYDLQMKDARNIRLITGKQTWFLHGLSTKPAWVKNELLDRELDGYLLGCTLIHKHLFETYGLFDSSLRFASDFDWFFRLKDDNEVFNQVDEVVLMKRIHELNESRHAEASLKELTKSIFKSIQRKRSK